MENKIKKTNQDTERKAELIEAAMELQPVVFDEEVSLTEYTEIPYTKVAALGTAFEPLTAAFQFVVSGGEATSGLYWVSVPKGGHLAAFKDGSGFLGSVLKENGAVGGGQARINPLILNPTMLFVAASLLSLDKKLDRIQQTQQDILSFLVQKERAEVKGSLQFLNDLMNTYKYNWNNENFKSENYGQVLSIRKEADQKIPLYREQIMTQIGKKSFLRSSQDVKRQLEDVKQKLGDYQMSVYLFAFASYLEVLLLENFDKAFLDQIVAGIEKRAYQYRELYTQCYDKIERHESASIQSQLLKGIANVEKIAGQTIAKVPVISKSQIDENLIEAGEKIHKVREEKSDETLAMLSEVQSSYVHPFVENLNKLNDLYNQPLKIVFDKENLYIKSETNI